jgi:hypothetical protein
MDIEGGSAPPGGARAKKMAVGGMLPKTTELHTKCPNKWMGPKTTKYVCAVVAPCCWRTYALRSAGSATPRSGLAARALAGCRAAERAALGTGAYESAGVALGLYRMPRLCVEVHLPASCVGFAADPGPLASVVAWC